MIYVEAKDGNIQAFVQFFGVLQFWVEPAAAPDTTSRLAMMGSLDPVTGQEQFEKMTALSIKPWKPGILMDASTPIQKFNGAARARGARSDSWKLNSIRIDGKEVLSKKPYLAISWTGEIQKKPPR